MKKSPPKSNRNTRDTILKLERHARQNDIPVRILDENRTRARFWAYSVRDTKGRYNPLLAWIPLGRTVEEVQAFLSRARFENGIIVTT